jgi:ribosomal protein S18 acetylase RimI-like enzyme
MARLTNASISLGDNPPGIAVVETIRRSRASGGWSHSKVTPTTCSPAPTAYRISVVDGRRETIRMALTLRVLEERDVDALQELLESDPGYTERVTGYPPGPSDALSTLLMRPEGLDEESKVVFGGFEGGELVSVLDVLRGYPTRERAFLGLLVVRGDRQGEGLGRMTVEALAGAVAENWPEITRLRLAVVETNAHVAQGFWERLGFEPTGEEKPYRYDRLESTSRLWERDLRP